MEKDKNLEYWKQNATEDYITTPISVLKYITKLEEELESTKPVNVDLADISPCYLNEILYYKENEGTAKPFRNIRTEKWYTETELAEIIGIKNVDALKTNKG